MSLYQLQPSTIKLITSAQVITSVSTAVKELVENALDAASSVIEVRLENNGLDKLEVKDNGCGIAKENISSACLPHYTSKIKDFNDLDELESYGFRGEALSSLCQISQINITTKTNEDEFGTIYTLGKNGEIVNSKPIAFNLGTQITVNQLFKNLPVRKQFLKSGKKALEDLKKTEYFLKSFGTIHPNLKLSFFHNKCLIWQKSATKTIKQSLMQVISLQVASKLYELEFQIENISIYMLIPKKDVEDINFLCKSNIEHMMIFVKKRPIRYKKVEKVIVKCVSECFRNSYPQHKYPYCLININISSHEIDVNLEPNKTKILIKNEESVIQEIEKQLMLYYCQNDSPLNSEENRENVIKEEQEEQQPSKKIRLNDYKSQILKSITNPSHEELISNENEKILLLNKSTNNNLEMSEICNNTITNIDVNFENEKILNKSTNDDVEISEICNNTITNIDENLTFENMNYSENLQTLKINENLIKQQNIEKHFESKQLELTNDYSDLLNGLTQEDFEDFPDPLTQHPNIHSHIQLSETEDEDEDENKLIKKNSISNKDCKIIDSRISERGIEEHHQVDNRQKDNSIISENASTNMNETLPSPSSQMGKKDLSGFTKFTKEIRPLIIQQNPGISFTRVAAMLVDQWKSLDEETRSNYDKVAKEINKQKQHRFTIKSISKDMNNISKSKKSITDWLLDGKEKRKRPKRKEIKLNITIDDLMNKTTKPEQSICSTTIPQLIGQLKSELWTYKLNNEIGIVRHWGLEEIVTFHKLMEEEYVECHPIEPLKLEKDNLNAECYEILSQMDTSFDISQNSIMISNPLVLKNGFKIEVLQDSSFIIKEMATHISTYGTEDLIEILNLISINKNINKFYNFRPTKIKYFFQSEAIRLTRSNQMPKRDDLKKLMIYWQTKNCDSFKTIKCLHNSLIFYPTINLQNNDDFNFI